MSLFLILNLFEFIMKIYESGKKINVFFAFPYKFRAKKASKPELKSRKNTRFQAPLLRIRSHRISITNHSINSSFSSFIINSQLSFANNYFQSSALATYLHLRVSSKIQLWVKINSLFIQYFFPRGSLALVLMRFQIVQCKNPKIDSQMIRSNNNQMAVIIPRNYKDLF